MLEWVVRKNGSKGDPEEKCTCWTSDEKESTRDAWKVASLFERREQQKRSENEATIGLAYKGGDTVSKILDSRSDAQRERYISDNEIENGQAKREMNEWSPSMTPLILFPFDFIDISSLKSAEEKLLLSKRFLTCLFLPHRDSLTLSVIVIPSGQMR